MKNILLSLSFLFLHFYISAQPLGNRGMYFDGIDDQVKCSAINLNNFTIEFWIKTTQTGGLSNAWQNGYGLVDAEDNGAPNDYGVSLGNGKIVAGIGDGNPTPEDFSLASVTSVNDGAWHHVAVTRSGNNMQIFIDGDLNASGSAVDVLVPVGNVPLTFGSLQTNLNYFKGQLDEIRVFSTVRSEPEIEADMISTATNIVGLVGYWNFEQGTGQTANDVQTNTAQNNGTLGSSGGVDASDPTWALRVKNTADSGLESLRDVITNANTLAGLNYIDFSIQQANPATVSTITVSTAALPTISDAVIIDGYSAFGSLPNSAPFGSTNNAQIRIEVNAPVAVAGGSFGGITLENVNNSVIKGLSVYGVPSNGLSARGISILGTSTNNSIEGCFIGLYANGTFDVASRNYNGIGTNANNNTIGWNIVPDVSKFNVIANSVFQGITIGGDNSKVQGNYVGTTNNPLTVANNSGRGVIMAGSNGAITSNIIGNSGDFGVLIAIGPHLNNKISQNRIFNNTLGGISLGAGANNNKPAPTITSATTTTISGNCTSCAAGEIVEVFDNPPGENQGRTFLGTAAVNAGIWSFAGSFIVGNRITATITDASGNTSPFSTPFTVATAVNTFFTLGNANWNSTLNWSSDGSSTPCGCKPEGVIGATVVIRSGHTATLINNANLGLNNIINIQDAGSTLELGNISTFIQSLNGQAGTRILMRTFTFPPITNNNYATTPGTIVEFAVNASGTIPDLFGINNYRNLVINGSGGPKNAGGAIVVDEDFSLLGGDVFHVGSDDFTVNGVTTIAPSSMFIDNATGGVNIFGLINNDGVLSAIGGGTNNSAFNFKGDIINSLSGTVNLDCNCQYDFNKAIAPPLLLQPGGQMIFGNNGGGSGNIFSDLTIGDGALVTFNVTNLAQLLIANDKVVNNNNFISGVMINGNGAINGANANSRWVQGNNAQLYYNSDVPIMNTGIFDATSSNTVFYSRAGDQVIKGTTYHSIVFGGSGLRNVATGNFIINTNLTIPSNITFQINGNNFTANGTVTIVGTFNDSGAGGTNTFNDIVQVNTGGVFAVVGSNTTVFIFRGNITNQGTFNLINSTQWVFDADLTIQNQSASPMTFADINSGLGTINGNITISDFAGGGNVVLNANGGITLNGSIINQLGDYPTASRLLRVTHLNGSGTLTNVTNAVIDYRSDQPSTANLNLLAFNNLFVYSFGNVPIKSTTFHHLKIIGTGNKTLTGDITVNGNLEIVLGAGLNTSNFDINIKGNWIGIGTFIAGTGKILFSGSNSQNISSNSAFNNIEIANSAHVNLINPIQTSTITLTTGRLRIGTNDITLTATPATNQITQPFINTSTSYIETDSTGRLIRNNLQVGTAYIFPIGSATSIRHISITPNTAGNATARFASDITPAVPNPATNNDQSAGRWLLSGLSGATVSFENSGCIGPFATVKFLDGTNWSETGITTVVIPPVLPNSSAYVASGTNVSFLTSRTFTVFGAIPIHEINVATLQAVSQTENQYILSGLTNYNLPVQFLSTNKDIAEIVRDSILIVKDGEGETDILAFNSGNGSNIPATDSVLVLRINRFGLVSALNTNLDNQIQIYPNPATDKVSIETTKNLTEIKNIELMDIMGTVLNKSTSLIHQSKISISLKEIPNGVYLIRIITNRGVFLKRVTKL
ncbi:MAG: T9SS type A sorting domain-containing protein [Raineya sp.]|jgi:hypothetical protein|nr:T9SS type A sorting domain-containing protein [Raineya sp.]